MREIEAGMGFVLPGSVKVALPIQVINIFLQFDLLGNERCLLCNNLLQRTFPK
jgi:hypothetical protein